MEAKSRQTNIKMTARKLRRVINEVRGKAVNEALDMLRFMPYFAARVVEKNVKAAAANAFESSLTVKPRIIAFEAEASITSASEISPTPT